ncbi:hypothetical protein [Candidatus Ichthyocystis hellenicum]|uniref:hypothetical protein n=1 Tax=Candidatus Ichthyocystis hellenicum TaxID=1561003 RepID=UPI000B886CBB|nr:hypothetical protein [Candidatus Ichthyocystis hellenicum]
MVARNSSVSTDCIELTEVCTGEETTEARLLSASSPVTSEKGCGAVYYEGLEEIVVCEEGNSTEVTPSLLKKSSATKEKLTQATTKMKKMSPQSCQKRRTRYRRI